jgi:hypothetical protein
LETERRWQAPEHVKITAADHGDLKITRAALGPRSPETADGPLSCIRKSHRRVNDDVVEMAIAIEVDWDRVRVFVVVMKGPIELVFPDEFRAVHTVAISEAANHGSMEQLGLR